MGIYIPGDHWAVRAREKPSYARQDKVLGTRQCKYEWAGQNHQVSFSFLHPHTHDIHFLFFLCNVTIVIGSSTVCLGAWGFSCRYLWCLLLCLGMSIMNSLKKLSVAVLKDHNQCTASTLCQSVIVHIFLCVYIYIKVIYTHMSHSIMIGHQWHFL